MQFSFWAGRLFQTSKFWKTFLKDNEIQFLQPKISTLVNVELLTLSSNEIFSLDESIFESLTDIYMTDNKLEKLPKNLFKNNLKCTEIWFSNNKIKFIDANMFDHLKKLTNADLWNNLCTQGDYYANRLIEMRNDLKRYCSENAMLEALESSMAAVNKSLQSAIENSELQMANLQEKLHSQLIEIDELKDNAAFIYQENKALQRNMDKIKREKFTKKPKTATDCEADWSQL